MAQPAVPEPGVPAPFQVVKVRPPLVSKGKLNQVLHRTDALSLGVQVVTEGGETNLHAHAGQDAVWLVLEGEATFYTSDDAVVARLGPYDSLMIPREAPYWFESTGDRPLVILRFGAKVAGVRDARIDHSSYRAKPQEVVAGAYFEGNRSPT